MSVTTLNSFNPETGMFISAPAGRPDHNEDLAAAIHRIGDPPDFLGVDGDWQVCPDPTEIDGVCLVRGSCTDPVGPSGGPGTPGSTPSSRPASFLK